MTKQEAIAYLDDACQVKSRFVRLNRFDLTQAIEALKTIEPQKVTNAGGDQEETDVS